MDLYKVLKVSQDASQEEIKRAYRKLALQFHPDKCQDPTDKFTKINHAYQVLSDPEKRRMYDGCSMNKCAKVFNNILYAFFNIILKQREANIAAKNLTIEIVVDIDEIYHKAVKKICIKVIRYDSDHNARQEVIPLYLSLLNYPHYFF